MDGGAGRSAPERGSVTGLVSHASRSRAQTVACRRGRAPGAVRSGVASGVGGDAWGAARGRPVDRKSTRLNSSHLVISYAVFCLKKKKKNQNIAQTRGTG